MASFSKFYSYIDFHRGTRANVVITIVRLIPVEVRLAIVAVPVSVRHVARGPDDNARPLNAVVATMACALVCFFHPLKGIGITHT